MSPNGIRKNSNSQKGVMTAVFGMSAGSTGEAVMAHVDQETKVAQEVSSNDGTFDVSNDKHPTECAAQSQIQCEGSLSVRLD